MEFKLNKKSSQQEIEFALNYPGQGNIIVCDDEIFKKITNQPERLNPETQLYDKEKDDAMGNHYASQIVITEMR